MTSDASRESILSAIRASAVRPIIVAPDAGTGKQRATKPDKKAVVSKFAAMLEAVGGEAILVENDDALSETLRKILSEDIDGAIILSGNTKLEEIDIADLNKNTGQELLKHGEYSAEQAASAATGITTAEAGIADTGTVVLRHTAEEGRLAALLPPTHIVIIEQSKIFADKSAYLQDCRKEDVDLSQTPITWVTGPSLTADIEKVLVRGAHGPKRFIALII